MTEVVRSALLPYAAEEVFALVNDVARYREFLPFCIASEVLEQRENEVVGRMAFARLGLSQALVTRNLLTPHSRIAIEFVEGPFTRFSGEWGFQALQATACKVSFSVDFEVQAKFLQFAAAQAIGQAAAQAVDAFHKRAVQLYGKR
ncbi:MAG: type II toxin-antitoxin system RatA family toxin [Moraxellaceae bacterium]|nr:type II toxin-antitoxin system RatA family toxin [Moraxellaceae bacterium]